MVALLFVATAFQFRVRTAIGQQCPTVSVQLVTVALKDCCGKIVGYTQRTPKPGESAFIQCRCAEKKATHHQALTSPKLDLLLARAVAYPQPEILKAEQNPANYCASEKDRITPPSIRPPATC
jgi:hypothetical protein